MIYYSARTRKALAERRSALPLGFAHYSYSHVCGKFVRLLSKQDILCTELMMPEIYATAADAPGGRHPGNTHIHISFKPFDEIRILKDAVNICHVYWEFDRLPSFDGLAADDPRRQNIFNDYTHILTKASEVWVACSYTKRALVNQGIKNVHLMPAPIAMPPDWKKSISRRPTIDQSAEPALLKVTGDEMSLAGFARGGPGSRRSLVSRVTQARRENGKIFLAIFNPGDRRKNAPALLAGFQRHLQRTGRNDLLIIKLVVDGKFITLQSALKHDLPIRFNEMSLSLGLIDTKNIIYTSGVLTDAEMGWFYRLGDFYMCASSAEGQNLPMMEAMSHGLVPISTAETAMSDYISDRNAFVVPTTQRPIAHAYGLQGVTWAETTPADIADALGNAVQAQDRTLDAKRSAGFDILNEKYSEAAVLRQLAARLSDLSLAGRRIGKQLINQI